MNKSTHPNWRRYTAGVLSAVLVVYNLIGTTGTATAQQLPARLSVRSCDTSKFPSVTCAVSLVDPQGLTITGVPATAFSVSEGSTPLTIDAVAEAPGADASTSTLLVVDMSGSLSGKYVSDLRTAVETSLKDKPINELVGLIALTGKIETPASAETITLDPQRESTFSKDANDAVINKLRGLSAATSTPLHDGLIKAILMVRKQPFGARAIVVMTDGFDTRSTTAKIDDVINLARQDGIPIYTFGFGSTTAEDNLKRISVTTGGAFAQATDATTVATQYRAIQDRLKNQYTLSFVLPGNDKGERKLTFNASLPTQSVTSAETTFKPEAPEIPVIEGVKFLVDGQEQQPTSLQGSVITVEPVIFAKAVSRVEYQVNSGDIVVKDQQPFTFSFRTDALDPAASNQLTVKVYGSESRQDLVAEQVVPIAVTGGTEPTTAPESAPESAPEATVETVAETPQATAIPTSTPTDPITLILAPFLENPILLIALAVGLLALLALLAMIIASASRRRRLQQAGPPTDVLGSPFTVSSNFPPYSGSTGTTGGTGFDTGSGASMGTQIFGAPSDDKTQIFMDPNEGQKTQIWQAAKAMLEVMSGPTQGDKLPVGVGGKTNIVIGRDANPLDGDLKLPSGFVSRKHAEIVIEGDDLYLVDLGSSSGTRVNGERINASERTKIEIGNEISFADVKVKVIGPDA
jgi:Mg-chelatase subunit ChlD